MSIIWRIRALTSYVDTLLITTKPAIWITQSHKVTVVSIMWAVLLASIAGVFLPLEQQQRPDCCYQAGDHLARSRFIDQHGDGSLTVVAFDGQQVFEYAAIPALTIETSQDGRRAMSILREVDVSRRNGQVFSMTSGEFLGDVMAVGAPVLRKYNFEVGEFIDGGRSPTKRGFVMIHGTGRLNTGDIYVVFWLSLVVSAGMIARWSWIQARSLRALPFSSSLWISPLLLYCCTMLSLGPFLALYIYFGRAGSVPYSYANPLTSRQGAMTAIAVVCLLHIVGYIMAAYGIGLVITNVVLFVIVLWSLGYLGGFWALGRVAAIGVLVFGLSSLLVCLFWPVRRRTGRFVARTAMAAFLLIAPSMAMWAWRFDRLATDGTSDVIGPMEIAMWTAIGFVCMSYALERRLLLLRAVPLATRREWRWLSS